MEEQKKRTLSLLASIGLGALGAVAFIADFVLLISANVLSGTYSLLVMWSVFLVLLIGGLIMPGMAYKHTASVKAALTVFILQTLFVIALAMIIGPVRWVLWIFFAG